MKESYERITYKNTGLYMFLVDLQYRTPHFHKDIEIGVVLDGQLEVISPNERQHMRTGDFYITNPFQRHEFYDHYPCRLLVLQVPVSYFKSSYPQIETTEFTQPAYHHESDPALCEQVRTYLLSIGKSYFRQDPLQGLTCASGVYQLFCHLLTQCPTRTVTEEEIRRETRHGQRMRKLIDYIDAHYEEKILLSDFA